MSISSVISIGIGSWGSPSEIIMLGFSEGEDEEVIAIVGPCAPAAQVYLPGAKMAQAYLPGAMAGDVYLPGARAGGTAC